MTHKRILLGTAARGKILLDATTLTNAVRITLEPKSKSLLLQSKWGAPTVCNHGVAIAKEIDLMDSVENMGAQM